MGIFIYVAFIQSHISRKEQGMRFFIGGFLLLAFGGALDIFYNELVKTGIIPIPNAAVPFQIAINFGGYILGVAFIVIGIYRWSLSVAVLQSTLQEVRELKDELIAQNASLQEKSRDLEIRTVDYLQQREAAIASEKSKTNFLRNTSHELRTPLNAIIGLSEILKSGQAKDARQAEEFAGMILTSGRTLLKTIDTILEIARIRADDYAPSLKQQSLEDALEQSLSVARPKAQTKNIGITCTPPPEQAPTAIFDATATSHVLIRLLDNAVTYSPANSEITIESGFTGQGSNRQVKVSIKDQGPGIDPDFLDSIFELFSRAERWQNRGATADDGSGTGLGLALCYRMTEVQNGRLDIQSDGTNGTQCNLYLPAPETGETDSALALP
ncbi:sensor histidine kinase [Sneathiella chinensis]|uniref:sensor histidine kinase n=1 Tax=Sneathiella chinensis TaxID=349750 RepID=UPI00146E85AA|nr:HAMP domain-containing sensor histidine kinase [Sneathiella chinensis]